MQAILGVIFYFIRGVASASFYVPFKKVVEGTWESYWIIGGIFPWAIVPFISAYITVPYFIDIMGESKQGSGASAWILHMAFIILLFNGWGIALKEWKGVRKKTFTTLLTGIAVIILSVVMVGYGNAI